MNNRQPVTRLDRVTIFLGIGVPLLLTLGVSVHVASLMLSGAFPEHELTVKLIVLAWLLLAVLCLCFMIAVRRQRSVAGF